MLILERGEEDRGGTPGFFTLDNVLICGSLELPWMDNAHNISCVPPGTYKIAWTYSEHLQGYTWELLDVPDRTGIRIHAANFLHQLEGCIAPGNLSIRGPSLWAAGSDICLKLLDEAIVKHEVTQLTILPAGSRS